VTDRNAGIIEEFRANEGRVGGFFEGRTLLLLTHRGARTGRERTNPLAYRREGDRIFVFATKGGSPTHPAWYHNLIANPDVTVEIGTERWDGTAVVLTGAERDEVYARQAADWPQFGQYQEKSPRTIPVVELVRSG
jgi:deazaflavin-dependent oxidoreductase (nitroreductase family)